MPAQRPDDRGNLQIIVVNLNGNNTTLQEALQTVHDMIRKDNPPAKPLINGKAKPKALPGAKNKADEEEQDPQLFVDPIMPDPADDDDEDESSDPPPAPTKKKPTIPKVIPDLDFNSETPTFRDFVAEKKPKDQFDWYLLVASWLKDKKQIQEIGINHVYTASRYIGAGWSLPDDVGQPFRDGRRKALFIKAKKGLSTITHIGEDLVKRMG